MKLPFNPGDDKVQIIVGTLVALFLLASATQCHGAELQFGAGRTVYRGPASVMELSVVQPNFIKDASLVAGVTLVGESTFYNYHVDGQIAWHAQIVDGFGPFDIGIGGAYLKNTDYNSAGMNFMLTVGYHLKRVGISLNHWSNAGTSKPNIGRDYLLLTYRF